MKRTLKLAAISGALTVNFGAAYAQNPPTPKPEDVRETLFRHRPLGKMHRLLPTENKDRPRHMDANPESRMNDDPPPQERAGAPNTAPK